MGAARRHEYDKKRRKGLVGEVREFDNETDWLTAVFGVIAEAFERSDGDFGIALCGGRSPVSLYRGLSEERRPAAGWRIFFTDERCVPPDDGLSNYGRIKRLLLGPSSIPEEMVFRIRGELGPGAASEEYQKLLEREAPDGLDLMILGLGADGHIASLFPGSPCLTEKIRWVAPVYEAPYAARVTLTPGMIFRTETVILLVRGDEKREACREFLKRRRSLSEFPSMLLHEHRNLHVMIYLG
ncbi:MAG TPA: 6-phosphogluconolactonase [Nitrospirae bacterium]|nr:6-phosphogluconolactonase [Nitrospirota bacterium]HDY72357.1 6-phosphogluconolactonase [Nitrospirota bacterium]